VTAGPEDLNALLDREKIRDCLARLSRGLDRRDATLVRGAYWPDAIDDQAVAVSSVEELLTWVVPGDPAMILTAHSLGQSLIELRGATALVETYVTAYHRLSVDGSDRDIVVGGRYLDRLQKRDQDWRITHRSLLADWCHDFGAAADWSKGLFGMPFLGEHGIGRAHGDHSETFFAP
jgi:SnoaL-like domain